MADHRQGVIVLGSTGSIGVNTLDVLARHPTRYRVAALTAHSQIDRLFEQCRRFRPRLAVVSDEASAAELQRRLRGDGLDVEVEGGPGGLVAAAELAEAQVVMAAIVGAAGLLPTLAAVRAGKRVLVANKEPLVMSGGMFVAEAQRSGAVILPIDSEHNAIFQCLPSAFVAGSEPDATLAQRGIRRIILTGSGGPFRALPSEALDSVTPEQACAHPNWVMGRKISVDSATLMNKGLELIEACWLFHAAPDDIQVVVHPQSVVHSLVEYVDGSVLAQLASPDMRVPIAHALAWPERMESGAERLDLLQVSKMEFEAPRRDAFPCLRLAEQVARAGGTAPTILNAANEVAVAAFLQRRIRFTEIHKVIADVLDRVAADHRHDLEAILAVDDQARRMARGIIERGNASTRHTAVI